MGKCPFLSVPPPPPPPHFRDASAAFVDTWALHAAQLVRALHRNDRAAGSIPAEDLYRAYQNIIKPHKIN